MPESPEPDRGNRTRLAWIVGGLVVIGVFAGLLLLSARKTHESPMRASCKTNIRQIGIALRLYADEADGEFPPTLLPLYPQYTDNVRIFSCPKNPSSHVDFTTGRITDRSSSYTYVPGLTSAMPGAFIAAYDKSRANHDKHGLNVLYVDGSVEWWRIEDKEMETLFHRRLALQAEAIAKWRASGKPVKDFAEFISPELRELMAR